MWRGLVEAGDEVPATRTGWRRPSTTDDASSACGGGTPGAGCGTAGGWRLLARWRRRRSSRNPRAGAREVARGHGCGEVARRWGARVQGRGAGWRRWGSLTTTEEKRAPKWRQHPCALGFIEGMICRGGSWSSRPYKCICRGGSRSSRPYKCRGGSWSNRP